VTVDYDGHLLLSPLLRTAARWSGSMKKEPSSLRMTVSSGVIANSINRK